MPYTVWDEVSVKVAEQVPVKMLLSSPLIVAVIVKSKFTEGVVVLVARVTVYA